MLNLPSLLPLALLALATFASEDLTCIAAGVMVAEGHLSFAGATLGCLTGILAGDLLLYFSGRVFGRRVLTLPGIRRLITAPAVERGSAWLRQRGPVVVLITRFLPGTRVATYVAAGILGTDGWKFALWFTLAAVLWTPTLVGASTILGSEVVSAAFITGRGVLLKLLVAVALFALTRRLVTTALTWPGRRRLFARWRRWSRWEFWPAWMFYSPVIAYIALLMIKHRSVTAFTAANPGILGGGFIAESKFDILRSISYGDDRVARAALISADLPNERRIEAVRAFIDATSLRFPVVLKPNQGQRGSGVVIVRTMEELRRQIAGPRTSLDLIVQEYVPGLEFGVFYYRRPSESRGHLFSITEKRFPVVRGDGRRTLGELILADDRAVCLEHIHRRVHRARLDEVPASGASVQLVEIGSHCRGAVFLDATHLVTPAVEEAFDAIASRFDGFFFGRFDVRTPSLADFTSANNFKIVELNGVTSEATNIYDAANSAWTAWRVLFAQWRLAFEIGAENRRRGAATTSVSALCSLMAQYRRLVRWHPQPLAS